MKEARELGVCRICRGPIFAPTYLTPFASGRYDWRLDNYLVPTPAGVVILHHGFEFAHEDCLDRLEPPRGDYQI